MNTLTTSPLAPVLARLSAEALASSFQDSPFVGSLDDAQLDRMMRSKTGYLDFYAHLKHLPLAVSAATGNLLYMLARGGRARSIVEFGTSLGISTLYLAAALRENGGGHLITTEFEAAKIARARRHFDEAGVADLVELREGDALQTLSRDLPEQVDLLFLDGAKALYPEVLAALENHLRLGAFIVADNASYSEQYLQQVRTPGNGYLSIALTQDVELTIRLG